jgi:hypothetical protein
MWPSWWSRKLHSEHACKLPTHSDIIHCCTKGLTACMSRAVSSVSTTIGPNCFCETTFPRDPSMESTQLSSHKSDLRSSPSCSTVWHGVALRCLENTADTTVGWRRLKGRPTWGWKEIKIRSGSEGLEPPAPMRANKTLFAQFGLNVLTLSRCMDPAALSGILDLSK